MESYTTLVDAINGLKAKGYTEDFNIKENYIDCNNGKYQLSPDDFKVDNVFRFEGESDPEDQSVLYAISAEKYNLKGLLVNAYGMYSDSGANEVIKKLKIHEDQYR
jgi:hypothetical protein